MDLRRCPGLLVGTLAALGAALLLCLAGPACKSIPEQKLVRLVDTVWAQSKFPGGSTALYPRAQLGDDWRAVLARDGKSLADNFSRQHGAVELTLEPGSILHFGYGIEAGAEEDRRALFTVTAHHDGVSSPLFKTGLETNGTDAGRWHEAEVSLAGFTGEVSLVFTSQGKGPRRGRGKGTSAPLAHFSAPVIVTEGKRPERPNLLLVSLDTLRADRLGIYGYKRETSPNIDRIFSSEGLVVERSLSEATDTLRGHASMFTGLNPSTALTAPGTNTPPFIHPWVLRLADVLRSVGYRTAAFTENAWVQAYLGFAAGFESFVEDRETGENIATPGRIRETFERGTEWIKQHHDESFFVFLHTYQVHAPYTPPTEHAFASPEDAPMAQTESDLYDGEIAYTDTWVATLIETIRASVPGNTIIVLTSDHGEEFGEHGGRGHGAQVVGEVLHVPILFHAPGILPAGVRRKGPMSVADLMPTILELMGLPVPEALDGHSLAVHLKTGRTPGARDIFAEARGAVFWFYGGQREDWIPPSLGVTRWPWRLARIRSKTGPRWELYDLDSDPAENKNLYRPGHEQALALRPLLDGYEARSADHERELEAIYGWGPGTIENPVQPETDPQLREKLRSLGYLGDAP